MATARRRLTRFAAIGAALSFCCPVLAAPPPTDTMTGHWQGSARIIVSWCQQTNLPVQLDLRADASVSGKIGDAQLVGGQFKRNRGWLGRKLNIKTDYIITGRLEGDIVAVDGIRRSRVMIPLNFSSNDFRGGLHTSGWPCGGKHSMRFSAAGLVLQRTNAPARLPSSLPNGESPNWLRPHLMLASSMKRLPRT